MLKSRKHWPNLVLVGFALVGIPDALVYSTCTCVFIVAILGTSEEHTTTVGMVYVRQM